MVCSPILRGLGELLFPPPILNWALPGSRPGARTLRSLSLCCHHTRLFIPWMQPGRLARYLQRGVGSKEGGAQPNWGEEVWEVWTHCPFSRNQSQPQ